MQNQAIVVNVGPERQQGRKSQQQNIQAAKTVADVIRTCLGPRAMLKMILDPMGGILLTNDGNAILREIEVAHPAAKSMIELSRTQDEEVGDGTTSVIILAGEILAQAMPHLERNIHPVVIISAFKRALEEALTIIESISIPVDPSNEDEMLKLIKTSIGTKFVSRWSDMMCKLALKAVRTVAKEENGNKTVDIKRYAKVEKVPGGEIEDSCVLDGVMLNKDVTHPNMRRRIENPRVVLLDCPLEYKKGESQTAIEVAKEEDWNRILEIEEEQVKQMAEKIIEFKPDIVFTEKGISDLAQHYLVKNNITAIRRVRKSDNNRIARATGATIVNRVDDLRESDVGTKCGLFHVEKLGDEYFTFLTKCQDPKACTILLRGPSKDVLHEVDRNLADAMAVARNVVFDPRLAPGGGATEMAISVGLAKKARAIEGVQGWPMRAVSDAMEVIPRTLVQNCGGNAIRTLTALRAKHAAGEHSFGVDGETGKVVDMKEYGLYESAAVKVQTLKTAIESACLLLRVDDIVSAKRPQGEGGPGPMPQQGGGEECFTFLTKCQDPKACTILLRGPSKDGLHEVDRNLADAMAVARNVVFDPRLAPGGGATEMAISVGLAKKARAIEGVQGWPMRAVSDAMEVIPRTLVQNCGGNAIRTLTALRAKHAAGEHSFGVDGETGKVVGMKEYGLYESAAVKVQTLKTAIESACLLLRVDDIVSAKRPQGEGGPGRRSPTGKPAQMRKTDNMVAAD
ncbi:T-complex protein 1 subunit gamma [Rhodotorula toruloides]|nr:T-complex protein 1 subunit gamma [Rhodotorula toruloides]